ncbi:hypothetical protein ACIRBY_24830 [Streptomyces sp. NPDC096136]|uniref:hypothetical protein n=1 Tax=Streptomyces sp. NPDC096136 TaxID=3366076 RepID=UPI00380602C8
MPDVEEADRHHLLRLVVEPRLVVVTTLEPEDGVNSRHPRGLVKYFTGDARSLYGRRPGLHGQVRPQERP